jgi:hypothetical protein
MSISFIKLLDSQKIVSRHLNINSSLGSGSYQGIQGMTRDMIAQHHHINFDLFKKQFPNFVADGSIKNIFADNDQTFFGQGYFGVPSRQPIFTSETIQKAFARWSLNWISGGRFSFNSNLDPVIYSSGNPNYSGVDWQEGDSNEALAYANHAIFTVPLNDQDVSNGSSYYDEYQKMVGYGFSRYSLFANEIHPGNIELTNDINDNLTWLAHIQDTEIHSRQLPVITTTGDADHTPAKHGFLNLENFSDRDFYNKNPLRNRRYTDDYHFDIVDPDDYGDILEVVTTDPGSTHPMLEEEGVYLWQGQKLRQLKLLKADPDDITTVKDRVTKSPLDSLFVNSKIYSDAVNQFFDFPNTMLDTFFYTNYYISGRNTEWKQDSSSYAEVLMNDGLGYQPRRGMTSGC